MRKLNASPDQREQENATALFQLKRRERRGERERAEGERGRLHSRGTGRRDRGKRGRHEGRWEVVGRGVGERAVDAVCEGGDGAFAGRSIAAALALLVLSCRHVPELRSREGFGGRNSSHDP